MQVYHEPNHELTEYRKLQKVGSKARSRSLCIPMKFLKSIGFEDDSMVKIILDPREKIMVLQRCDL